MCFGYPVVTFSDPLRFGEIKKSKMADLSSAVVWKPRCNSYVMWFTAKEISLDLHVVNYTVPERTS